MSQQNLISFTIPDKEKAEIAAAINTLRDKLLPRLKSLKPEERMEMLKMGDKTTAFVHKALEHCAMNPELSPQYLDIKEFDSDIMAVDYLRSIYAPLTQITDSISDTIMLAGSDAYNAALIFYTAVRSAHRENIAKAGTIYEDLATRFPGKKKARTTADNKME